MHMIFEPVLGILLCDPAFSSIILFHISVYAMDTLKIPVHLSLEP